MEVALLAEGVDRNWYSPQTAYHTDIVALLAEGVDRNCKGVCMERVIEVALLAEGVDRNTSALPSPQKAGEVALLAEGVDRNKIALTDEHNIMRSPSSRRAWIEIAVVPLVWMT